MPDEPRTLIDAVNALKDAWSALQPLSDHEVHQLRTEFLHPNPAVQDLWERATVQEVEIEMAAEKVDWRKASGEELALLIMGHLEINAAVERFYSSSFSISWFAAHRLFKFYLLKMGISLGKPTELVFSYARFYKEGRYAIGEAIRRFTDVKHGRKSCDPSVALASHFMSHDQSMEAADIILAESLKAVARRVRPKIRNTQNLRERDFVTESAATIWNYFNNSIMGLAQCLNGDETVIQAIANDMKDNQRFDIPKPIMKLWRESGQINRQAKKEKRNLTMDEEGRLEEIVEEIISIKQQIGRATMNPDHLAFETVTPEDVLAARETEIRRLNFEKKNPEKWALIQAYIDGIPQKELASKARKSPSAINQQLKKALKDLKESLKE